MGAASTGGRELHLAAWSHQAWTQRAVRVAKPSQELSPGIATWPARSQGVGTGARLWYHSSLGLAWGSSLGSHRAVDPASSPSSLPGACTLPQQPEPDPLPRHRQDLLSEGQWLAMPGLQVQGSGPQSPAGSEVKQPEAQWLWHSPRTGQSHRGEPGTGASPLQGQCQPRGGRPHGSLFFTCVCVQGHTPAWKNTTVPLPWGQSSGWAGSHTEQPRGAQLSTVLPGLRPACSLYRGETRPGRGTSSRPLLPFLPSPR